MLRLEGAFPSSFLVITNTCDTEFAWRVRPEQTPSTGLRHPSNSKHWFTTSFKLQALAYDILHSTTAVFSYAVGSRKLSAKEQGFFFFLGGGGGCSNSSNLLQTTQIMMVK